MTLNDLMSQHGFLPALVAVSVAFGILFALFLNSRWRIVDSFTTYAIRIHGGIRRFPTSITWLRTLGFENYEYVVKGNRNAARFEFFTRNRDKAGDWTVKKLHLMNRRTGAIDLRVHTLELKPFGVSSADHHDMEVHATLGFQLDRGRLFRCFQYANLGIVLLTRLEGFIRTQINSRQNEDVAKDITKMREAILADMRKPEDEDNEGFKAWLAKNNGSAQPNAYFRGTPSTALGIHITDLSLQVEQVDSDLAIPTAPANGQFAPALFIPPKYLDNMRDMFARGREDVEGANEALLRTLEMYTRENIARHVSKGQMIIISSDDLGLARTSAFRDSVRPSKAAKALDVPSPQVEERGKDGK